MDIVIRVSAMYLFLLVLMRLSGRRTLNELSPFDLVLVLMVGGATQRALLNEDHSLINACVVITTLIAIDIGLALIKIRMPRVRAVLDGVPTVIIRNGTLDSEALYHCRVTDCDIRQAARQLMGLERMDQIKYAILENDGTISIIPKSR